MPVQLDIAEFLEKVRENAALLLDARSEKEHLHACIPGASNVPLLNNERRHEVGTRYKQEGHAAAVLLGFKLVGPDFEKIITEVLSLANDREVLLYCWRGGLRSNIMSFLIESAGLKVSLLKGGYKTFRHFALDQFEVPMKLVVIGGRTGAGKTDILRSLKKSGEQVLDLEALANHKGSAFGALGEKAQPSYEQFENLIAWELSKFDPSKIIWVENESRAIGQVKIPDALFKQLLEAPLVEINASVKIRAQRILDEYGKFEKSELVVCTQKLQKRLGGLRVQEAVNALQSEDLKTWVNMLLEYYDNSYDYSMSMRNPVSNMLIDRMEGESSDNLSARIVDTYNENLRARVVK